MRPRLDAVTVRPGDKLVVRMSGRITREDVDNFTDQMRGLLPGVGVVVIAAEQLLVYRLDGGGDD